MEAFFWLNAISVIGERTILCKCVKRKRKNKSEGALELQSGKTGNWRTERKVLIWSFKLDKLENWKLEN